MTYTEDTCSLGPIKGVTFIRRSNRHTVNSDKEPGAVIIRISSLNGQLPTYTWAGIITDRLFFAKQLLINNSVADLQKHPLR